MPLLKTTTLLVLVYLCACGSDTGTAQPDAGPPADARPVAPDAAPKADATVAPVVIDLSADKAQHADLSGDYVDYSVERGECESRGWTKAIVETTVGTAIVKRKVLYTGPKQSPWVGTILVMHGGGGNYTNWCAEAVTGFRLFADVAVLRGFGVVLLDSTDMITDENDVHCGKVWDDKKLTRDNYDLPYIENVIVDLAPTIRPANSDTSVYVTGFSSGGFMTTRASSALNHLVTAFAPVGSGSPYGWHRDCSAESPRLLVAGVGLDNDTGQPITQVGACGTTIYDPDAEYPNERLWDDGGTATKPPFLKVHHFYDAIADFSCHNRVRNQLAANGYSGELFVLIPEGETRAAVHHTFKGEFIAPVLDFFEAN